MASIQKKAGRPEVARRPSKLEREVKAAEAPNKYQQLQRLLDDPTSSRQARAFMVVMTLHVVCSVVILCISTMPELKDTWVAKIHVEFYFSIVFSIELLTRVAIAETPWGAFCNDLYLVFDAVAVLRPVHDAHVVVSHSRRVLAVFIVPCAAAVLHRCSYRAATALPGFLLGWLLGAV